ncbi:MAG: beta-N-acetylhexosaminidase [Phycisphaerae bacterium]
MATDTLESLGLSLIPEPQVIKPLKGVCDLANGAAIIQHRGAPREDVFAARCLAQALKAEMGVDAKVASAGPRGRAVTIDISRRAGLPQDGYRLTIAPRRITIEGADAAGIYYACQTLRQCVQRGDDGTAVAPCLDIRDWPDVQYRAIHYDTKHHQPTAGYVESLIRQLASYKVNVLVWEWEDKFAYRSHPEVGAPGAFAPEQMRGFARFARQHHVQIVPLVQGLGHVSYILKHPRHRRLREIADSNWEFCPLKDGTYELLFDLWDEAIDATPGSELIHIGSDETYELGLGEACGCKARAEAVGKDGLMQVFIRRCVERLEKRGRKVISWGGQWKPSSPHAPPRTMRCVDFSDVSYLRAANKAGHIYWVYGPNPGITPLFLPHFPWIERSMWQEEPGRRREGVFGQTGPTIAAAAAEKLVEGSITTSWDDSGLHTQMWLPRFVCAAEFSWKAGKMPAGRTGETPMPRGERDVEAWTRRFFRNYFGPRSRDMHELFAILQETAEFYYDTLQRKVWHSGDVGKVHLPDFPRGDLEISNYWRRRYRQLVNLAGEQRIKLARATAIIDDNLARGAANSYDLEIMRSCVELMRHNAELFPMLGELEYAVCLASSEHYSNRPAALGHLKRAAKLIEDHLADRRRVFAELVKLWERTRLPKGMSLPGKPYVFARDRARHFANRTPDMTYLILDEKLLGLEDYLARLRKYIAQYRGEMDR